MMMIIVITMMAAFFSYYHYHNLSHHVLENGFLHINHQHHCPSDDVVVK